MRVTRDVVRDLLPLYLANEASADSRALVEAFLARDPELAEQVRSEAAEPLLAGAAPALPPALEIEALRRARRLIGWQKWLFGLALALSAFALSLEIRFQGGRLVDLHFLLRDHPLPFAALLALAAVCWTAYAGVRRKLRQTAL